MSGANWAMLRRLLTVKYDELRVRLRRRLGSDDLAREALHETYLQLVRNVEPVEIRSPQAYLYRIALNVAAGQRRSQGRMATDAELEAALRLADESAQPDQTVAARFDLALLERIIEELPPRRRAIFLAARVQDMPIADIAASHGVSKRLVELELQRALEYCAGRLDRQVVRRFALRSPKASYGVKDDPEPGQEITDVPTGRLTR